MKYFLSSDVQLLQDGLDGIKEEQEKSPSLTVGIQVQKNNVKEGNRLRNLLRDTKDAVVLADSDRCCVDWVAVLHSKSRLLLKASFSCPLLGLNRSDRIDPELRIGYVVPKREYEKNNEIATEKAESQEDFSEIELYLAVDSSYLGVQEAVRSQIAEYTGERVGVWVYGEARAENSLVFVLSENAGFLRYFEENSLCLQITLDALRSRKSFIEMAPAGSVRKAQQARAEQIIRKLGHAEKIKSSHIFGIVFTSADHMGVVDLLCKYLDMNGKKFYQFFINGLKPQKLGNFVGIDAFVVVQCPFSSFVFEDSVFAFKPYDVVLAFKSAWDGGYTTNLEVVKSVLAEEIEKMRGERAGEEDVRESNGKNSTEVSLGAQSSCNILKVGAGQICTEEQNRRYFQTGKVLKSLLGLSVKEEAEPNRENTRLHVGYSGIPTKYTKGAG